MVINVSPGDWLRPARLALQGEAGGRCLSPFKTSVVKEERSDGKTSDVDINKNQINVEEPTLSSLPLNLINLTP